LSKVKHTGGQKNHLTNDKRQAPVRRLIDAASTPFQHLVSRRTRSKERWHERDSRQDDRCWAQRQEHPPSRLAGSSTEARPDSGRACQTSRRGPRDRAPARNLGERRIPTYVAEISYGARGDARASRGRSPPRVSGGCGVGAPQPPERTPESACKSTSKEIVL
jgi:hypothetical protein